MGKTIVEDLVLIDADGQYVPGSRVINRRWSACEPVPPFGMIITVDYEENCTVFPASITVLWPEIPATDLDFSKFVFPIIRRTFAPLSAPDLVSIQPMSQPSGLIFHLDYLNSGSAKV
jgi:hypothetical protein